MGSRPAIGAALASRHPGRQHPDRRCGGKGKPGARCELHRAGRAAAREPSGGSWPKPDSRPHHVSRHRPGGSSWPPRHPGSWRGLCTSTRCSSGGCTSSSRWRSAPAGCTSWASPPAHRGMDRPASPQPAHGPRRIRHPVHVPHPRPRQHVHGGLRPGARRPWQADHPDAGPAAPGRTPVRSGTRERYGPSAWTTC